MNRTYSFITFLLIAHLGFAQEYNQYVANIINAINQDTIVQELRKFSGEDPVIINGQETILEHRVSNWGNNTSAEYLYEKLNSYGLNAEKQTYSMAGTNVLAIQEGSVYPDEYYMICGHYDAVDYYAADDNATSSVTVLEAARIMSNLEFEYSIIYALWDEEEIGLIGSADWAAEAAANGDIIHGVINMDMIGYDTDGDMASEIHTTFDANSNVLSDYLVAVDNLYNTGIEPVIHNPGLPYSDHSSFWNNGYAAILIIEEYFGGDFNPHYHTENDRVSILNMDYFFENTKLAIGTLAQLATIDVNVGNEEVLLNGISEFRIYPNPATNFSQLKLNLDNNQNVKINMLNSLGQEVLLIQDGLLVSGTHQIQIPLQTLETGIYILKVENENGIQTQKLIVN